MEAGQHFKSAFVIDAEPFDFPCGPDKNAPPGVGMHSPDMQVFGAVGWETFLDVVCNW